VGEDRRAARSVSLQAVQVTAQRSRNRCPCEMRGRNAAYQYQARDTFCESMLFMFASHVC